MKKFIYEQKAIVSTVQEILVRAEKDDVSVVYLCNNKADQRVNLKVNEKYAFKSKKDLLNSL